jgi:hypothetical protein
MTTPKVLASGGRVVLGSLGSCGMRNSNGISSVAFVGVWLTNHVKMSVESTPGTYPEIYVGGGTTCK